MDNPLSSQTILDSIGDGVYVTDVDRRILYWNQAADGVTGWHTEDVTGRSCEEILCHIDKDGNRLCGKEFCPLHRSIVSGASHECSLVLAATKDSRRVPLHMMVAPVRDGSGTIIGGVQVFHDISLTFRDLDRARIVQSESLQHTLPQDPRVSFTTYYHPDGVVGGDYYAIGQLSADQYGFLLTDVMGHGVAAALYTLYLRALWDKHYPLLTTPAVFAARINDEINHTFPHGETFVAGLCGMVDLCRQEVVFTGAGNPPVLLVHANGDFDTLKCSGVPQGVMEDAPYEETHVECHPGDRLLFYTDGAVEVYDDNNVILGVDGLAVILKKLGYPTSGVRLAAIEEEVLRYSGAAWPKDDVTFMEIHLAS